MISNTQERVFEAADALLQEGRRPTQQNVRERIGQGSLTTINKALNRWWEELGARLEAQRRIPELPEPVESAIKDIWQLALAHARHGVDSERQAGNAKVREAREALEAERRTQQEKLAAYQEKLGRAFDRIETLQQQVEQLREALHAGEEQQLVRERAQLAAEREQRALEAENRKLLLVAQNAEQDRDAIRQKINALKNKDQVESEVGSGAESRSLLEENRNLRTALDQADQRYARQQQQLERLREQLAALRPDLDLPGGS